MAAEPRTYPVDHGELIDTACLDIGGRLIKVDRETRKITYIAPKIQALIEKRGYPVKLGETTSPENLQPVLGEMVELLKNSVGLGRKMIFMKQSLRIKD